MAKQSREIIRKLDAEQKASLKESLEIDMVKWKNCFKWKEWSPNTRGPLLKSDKFALPETIPGIEEPLWVTSRR